MKQSNHSNRFTLTNALARHEYTKMQRGTNTHTHIHTQVQVVGTKTVVMTAVVNSCLLHIYVPAETGSFMSFQIVTRSSSLSSSVSLSSIVGNRFFVWQKHRDIRVRVQVQA